MLYLWANPGLGGGTGGGTGGGGGRSSANPFSANHWSAQYRGLFNNGINQSSGGNLVINWNAIGQYGGEWNPMDGYHDYQNSLEQAIAIISYNERHQSWGQTEHGNYSGFAKSYNRSIGTPLLVTEFIVTTYGTDCYSCDELRSNPNTGVGLSSSDALAAGTALLVTPEPVKTVAGAIIIGGVIITGAVLYLKDISDPFPGPLSYTKPDPTDPFYNSNNNYDKNPNNSGSPWELGFMLGTMNLLYDYNNFKQHIDSSSISIEPINMQQDATKYYVPKPMGY